MPTAPAPTPAAAPGAPTASDAARRHDDVGSAPDASSRRRRAVRAAAAGRASAAALTGLALLLGGCAGADQPTDPAAVPSADASTAPSREPLPEPFETVDRTLDELARTEDGSPPEPGSREDLAQGLGVVFEGGVRGLGATLEVLVDEGARIADEILDAERRSRPGAATTTGAPASRATWTRLRVR